MDGIFFWHKKEVLDKQQIMDIFHSLNYKHGQYITMGKWNIIVFPKTSYSITNWLTTKFGNICGVGTFSYKGFVYEKSLPIILKDVKDNKLDLKKFWGNFLILLNIGNRTVLIRDGAGISRLYGYNNKSAFSSSFNGLIRCSKNKLTLNKDSTEELLSTGLITGTQSLVKEIDFINIFYSPKINNLECLITTTEKLHKPRTFKDALNQQVEISKLFIKKISDNWFSYLPDSKLNLSITGGLDSRLLLSLVNSIHKSYNFYSYWRESNSSDEDFKLAKQIAEYVKKPIYYKKITSSETMSENELIKTFHNGFISSDGVIRPGSFWDEDFSSIKYRAELVPFPHLRLTGFEGEQYRNMERLPMLSYRSYKSWVRWDMIYRFAGHNFKSNQAQMRIEDQIVNNLEIILGKGTLNLITYKEYYRQAVVPSYRSLQTNIENKFGFNLSPFADTNLSLPARNSYPYLKNSLQFEIEMLKNISPELAGLPNDYGFNFLFGEQNKKLLSIKLWQLTPPPIKHKLFSLYKNHHGNMFITRLARRSNFINLLLDNVNSLNLEIDIFKLIKRSYRGKLVLNLGYFLQQNEEWIKC